MSPAGSAAARWIKDQVFFLIVLLALASGFGYLIIGEGHWLRSTAVMGSAMVLAALFRALLPKARVGLLSVRGRWLDTVLYLALGGVILAIDIRLHH